MMSVRYRKAPPLLAFGWFIFIRIDVSLPGDVASCFLRAGPCPDSAYVTHRGYCGHNIMGFLFATLAPDMADREIGMDPREYTSRSPSGQIDRFPWRHRVDLQYP
ncbi:hypothetical protein MTR67_052739 [Solanum verrucosum]|uniref:Uncharacterized protein n=1 Tax=Solanum verrucosum TaxID=315347 RepID=A0AAF0V8Y8_SOLVR|nr:hypothetical protein MTR67_052739 [Solanum verrucosum]